MSKAPPGTVIAAGFSSALAAGLTQLGVAYGLAVVMWRDATTTEWSAHLAWTAWLTAVAVIIGSLVSFRLSFDVGTRIIAALAAAIGGLVVAPLIAVPALRATEDGFTVAPFAAAGIGAVAGLVAATLALASRSIRINVVAAIAVTWVIAALAAFVPLGSLRPELVKLGMWGSWPGLVPELAPPLLAASAIIGVVAAWAAGPSHGAQHRITAISGMVGPLLIAAAYAAARQPSVGAQLNWTGIWVGVYAAVAGLLGSLLVAALRGTPAPPAPAAEAPPHETPRPVEPVEPVGAAPDDAATMSMPADGTNPSPYVSDHAYDESYDPTIFGEFAQEPEVGPDGAIPRVPKQAEPAEEMDDWVSELKDDNAFIEQREREEAARNAKEDDETEQAPKPKKKRKPKRKKQEKADEPDSDTDADTDKND